MSANIRPATPDDIDAMFAITCAVHQTPLYKRLIPADSYDRFLDRYKPSVQRHDRFTRKITERLLDSHWHIWVAEEDGQVCGFTMSRDAGETLELRGLFVDEVYQGRGIGKRLFETSYEIARPGQVISLEVLEANEHAIGIYARAGFQAVPEVPPTYYGATMIRMQKY